MKDFDYSAPTSVQEATTLLAEHGEQAKGKIVYDLERDFHVTGEALRRRAAAG